MGWFSSLFHACCYKNNSACQSLDAITRRVRSLETQGVLIMATLAELQAKIESINTTIDAERAEVQALLAGLRAQIQDLQNQIGAGQLVSQAQLDALAASADAIVARVQAISEPQA
jgi:chromosome segregation ATPase